MAYKKISISIDERTYAEAKEAVESGDFRSYSQLFEDGVKKVLQERRLEKSGNPCEASA